MKNNVHTINNIKTKMEQLIGHRIHMRIHKGRKKYVEINGIIENLYPNVFTIFAEVDENKHMSFSYVDVLTKDIQFLNFLD